VNRPLPRSRNRSSAQPVRDHRSGRARTGGHRLQHCAPGTAPPP
jgi:hypothetical protein